MSRAAVTQALYSVRITTDRATADLIESALSEQETPLVAWHDADRDRVRFDAFADDRDAAGACRRGLAALLDRLGVRARCRIRLARLAAQDWSESWKKSFRPVRIGRRIVIKPSWERFSPRPGDCVVEMDPGMSFGTGQHATTRACLRFMDVICRQRSGGSLLDVGCGSGVLAIAAAKLGYRPVWAIDHDPQAVKTTRQNAVRNGLGKRLKCHVEDLSNWRPDRTFDTVAANLLADTLLQWAERLAGLVAPQGGSNLLLAGILNSQYKEIRLRYESLGFEQVSIAHGREWTSGWLRRRGWADTRTGGSRVSRRGIVKG